MLYGIDASSVQRTVAWLEVAKSCSFGFEKVTQGTGYVNPFWPAAKAVLQSLQRSGKFVPGAYMFLEHGDAAAQADFFARTAGNLDGWLIAIDGEPTGSSNPDITDLNVALTRLLTHYPESQIGGYLPQWYWGKKPVFPDFHWLWASRYVNGSGSPEGLYTSVPNDWWADYGGKTVQLLQFTASARVPGVAGGVDASAYRGTLDQLKKLTIAPSAMKPTTVGEDYMYVFDELKGKQVVLPVPSGSTRVTLYAAPLPNTPASDLPHIDIICGPSSSHHAVTPSWEHQVEFDLVQNTTYVAFNRIDSGNTPVTIVFS